MIDAGQGIPVVLIPGIQGRWEWMQPSVSALASRCRVITFSLCGEPGSHARFDPELGFDSFVTQIDDVLARAGLEHAVVCGVSYGGLIALRYAAQRASRVRGLILTSTPSPSWTPDCRVEQYLRAPRLLAPLFVARSPGRLRAEVTAAFPDRWERAAFAVRHTARVVASRFSPVRMAERVRLLREVELAGDCRRISVPTLVITGEPGLDRVVPVESTRSYLDTITGATGAVVERTGHIGLITRPERFAGIVGDFAARLTGEDIAAECQTSPSVAKTGPSEERLA